MLVRWYRAAMLYEEWEDKPITEEIANETCPDVNNILFFHGPLDSMRGYNFKSPSAVIA